MKILITELIWDIGIEVLKKKGYSVHYDQQLEKDREKLLSVIADYDGLIVRNRTVVDAELLEKATNLKVIGRLGVGLDNIRLDEATEKGIKVVAAKHANATSVAEYVMASMMDASRTISEAVADVRQGNWDRRQFTGYELNGKTLGLYGLGEIAHRVAKRAHTFGMNMVGFDPFLTPYDHILAETGVKRVTNLEELLEVSDFISIHVPLTKSTANNFNRDTFLQMKKAAYLINTARGGIINEVDLWEAVKAKQIAGAYLDVLEEEPVDPNSPLLSMEEIKITPHIAGLTEESQQRTSLLVAEEVSHVLHGGTSLCAVN